MSPAPALSPAFNPAPRDPLAPARVLVIAPYPALRAGLRALLAGASRFEVAGEGAEWGGEADIDIVLAQVGSAELAIDLPARLPAVVLGPWTDGAPPLRRRSGARAWLPLQATADEVVAAMQAVVLGLWVFAPGTLPAAPERAAPADPPLEALTPREREVLQLVASGLPNKGIALRLGISEHTAKFHVGAVLSKLGAASRAEAVTIAIRNGVLTL